MASRGLALVLFMLPLAVYSAMDGIGRFLTTSSGSWSDSSFAATGIVSIVIAAIYWLTFGKRNTELHVKQLKNSDSQSLWQPNSGRRYSVPTQNLHSFFAATRPSSVAIKLSTLPIETQTQIERMDQYTDKLESLLTNRMNELTSTKGQLDQLLQQLLPPSVAQRLSAGESVSPASFDCVTIYFSDIVGYTSLVAQSTAVEMVEFLNAFYRLSDGIVANYDAHKMETIGDADLIASGIPEPNGTKHASELAKLALHMMNAFQTFRVPHRPNQELRTRIGLHSGHCMAGIVGSKIPKYCLFGDAVSTGSKMEATCEPGRIHVSHNTADILIKAGGFLLEARGPIQLKGKKDFETFWLNGAENPCTHVNGKIGVWPRQT